MQYEMAITAIQSLLSLTGIVFLVFWLYKDYRVDKFRQEVFELRDELFDYAMKGHISFDHPAYRLLRSTMNGFIRFGHKLNLTQVLFLAMMVKSDKPAGMNFEANWKKSTNKLSDDQKQALNKFRVRMDTLALKHVLLGSPEWFPVFTFILGIMICMAIIRSSKELLNQELLFSIWPSLKGNLSNVDQAAMICGNL